MYIYIYPHRQFQLLSLVLKLSKRIKELTLRALLKDYGGLFVLPANDRPFQQTPNDPTAAGLKKYTSEASIIKAKLKVTKKEKNRKTDKSRI